METDRQNQHMDTADSELSAAKMVLRLADELRQKESEIAALRMKTMEELQSHRKAKNAELDAVSRVQEERISKRERELAGTWVRREAELWNKYQSMLESITEKHRAELEAERARFQAEMNRRDREIPEQRDRLRAEMESAYVRWEKEREDRL
ncbi:MAG TPA: hypothetical protein VJC03_03790, partial [bacterium]|nr:hypothetical protein [bacterium]